MYKPADKTQTSFLDFNQPMGLKMNPANRWIQMADRIPWDLFEVKYPIGGTVFIRKDYFDKFLEEHTVKYFAFTERLIPETGYADETSFHFEIIDGKIVKEIKNAGGYGRRIVRIIHCVLCVHIPILLGAKSSYIKRKMDRRR